MRMDEEALSKTKRKQISTALQKLGVELVALNRARLDQLQLPEQLLDAVLLAKRLGRDEAGRRQMQYIGRIMRGIDAAPIQQQIDAWNGANDQEIGRLHEVERWRDRLIAEDASLAEFLSLYPACDSQQLRTLIRNTRKEQAAQRPPAHYRALFKAVRAAVQAIDKAEPDDMA